MTAALRCKGLKTAPCRTLYNNNIFSGKFLILKDNGAFSSSVEAFGVQKAGSYFSERISLIIRRGNVLGPILVLFNEIFFLYNCMSCLNFLLFCALTSYLAKFNIFLTLKKKLYYYSNRNVIYNI